MAKNVAQFMLERLSEWGVRRIYGYPGDGINGLLGAFHEVGDRIELTQMAHEEIASFAACAHAKFSGVVGVCMATYQLLQLSQDTRKHQLSPLLRGRKAPSTRALILIID